MSTYTVKFYIPGNVNEHGSRVAAPTAADALTIWRTNQESIHGPAVMAEVRPRILWDGPSESITAPVVTSIGVTEVQLDAMIDQFKRMRSRNLNHNPKSTYILTL